MRVHPSTQAIRPYVVCCILRGMTFDDKVYKSFIGAGYYETITPPVILRNVRILRFINIFLLP